MRILMISDVYFPRVNGVSTSIRTFMRSLRALGHEVRLIAPRYDAKPRRNRTSSASTPAGSGWTRRTG
nr:glycosyltransferase [Thiohalobacter thiocyanaticus]